MNPSLVSRSLFCIAVAVAILDGVFCYGDEPDNQAAPTPVARNWSPAVREALSIYQQGHWTEAQALCQRVLDNTHKDTVRLDAAVLQALCLLQLPARPDRLDGRGRLAQLAEQDPTLLNDPECNLAYGIAQAALSETADALAALAHAADGFAATGQPERELAALVALAETWVVHGEWDMTPPQLGVGRLSSPVAANAVRRSQIAALRARAEGLPNHEVTVARLDLILAKHLIDAAGAPEEGYTVLAQMTTTPNWTSIEAEAAMLLAEYREQSGQPAEAIDLYERIAKTDIPPWSRQAETRLQELTRTKIILDIARELRCGQPARVHLRTWGLDNVQVEVRQVNVEAWLSDRKTRGDETSLAESGSIQIAWTLATDSVARHAWWDSDQAAQALEFTAPAGAYAVIVRGRDGDGQEHRLKRLVVVSDLSAACLINSTAVVVWAWRAGDACSDQSLPAADASLHFWMQQSFVATEARLESGLAQFALPNEARVLRDKCWYCLVRSGSHFALCEGQVAANISPEKEAAYPIAVIGGPPVASVGETYYTTGMLLRHDTATSDSEVLELELRDATDQLIHTQAVTVSTAGTFAAHFAIQPEWGGKHLRVIPRRGGQTAENAAGRLAFEVLATDLTQYLVRCDLPDWLDAPKSLVTGTVQVDYPWGTAVGATQIRCLLDAVSLPTSGPKVDAVHGEPVTRNGYLNAQGRFGFVFSMSPTEFGLPAKPLAIRVHTTVGGNEGWWGADVTEALVAPQRPHVWLTYEPDSPTVGDPLCFNLGWFEPGGLATTDDPEITVTDTDNHTISLQARPTDEGYRTEGWRPATPGTYEVAATIPVPDRAPIRHTLTFVVGPASDTRARPTESTRFRAQTSRENGQAGVRVQLDDALPAHAIIVVETDEELAATEWNADPGNHDVFVPLSRLPRAAAQATIITQDQTTLDWLGTEPIGCGVDGGLDLTLSPPAGVLWPGASVGVTVRTTGNPATRSGALLLGRLIAAADTGYAWHTSANVPAETTPGFDLTTSTGAEIGRLHYTSVAQTQNWRAIPADWRAVLLEGNTLWAAVSPLEADEIVLTVPLPPRAGLYRLIVAACTGDGVVTSQSMALDARRGLRHRLDVPGRLTIGDRMLVALELENAYQEPIAVQVDLDAGTGMKIESIRVSGDQQETRLQVSDAPLKVELPAGARAWVQANVEATHVGAGQVTVALMGRDSRQESSGAYEVLPIPEAPGAALSVDITRTIQVWTAADTIEGTTRNRSDESRSGPQVLRGRNVRSWLGDDGPKVPVRWKPAPWTPGQVLLPGQCVQIREEFTLPEARAGMRWVQRIPPTCTGLSPEGLTLPSIGRRLHEREGELTLAVPPLPAGQHVHEYLLMVVRPGAGYLAAPEVHSGSAAILMRVNPDDLRVIVGEAR